MTRRVLIMPSPVSSGSIGSITKSLGVARKLRNRGLRVLIAAGGQLGTMAAAGGFEVADCPVPEFSGDVQHVKNVADFVSWTGMAHPGYVARTIEREVEIIRDFSPHAVFGQARPSAAISAGITGVPLASIASWPIHPSFKPNIGAGAELCEIYNAHLRRHGLPTISHVAELLFSRSALKISPSFPDLEPELSVVEDVEYTGHMLDLEPDPSLTPDWFSEWNTRPLILIYLSVGAIDPRIYLRTLPEAFDHSGFNALCLCGFHFGLEKFDLSNRAGNVRFANYVPTQNIIDSCSAVVFHGGQDTMLAALHQGLPSITFPGRHFERGYNSSQLERLGASRSAQVYDFRGSRLRRLVEEVLTGSERHRSQELGARIRTFGGMDRGVDLIEALANGAVS